MSVIPVRYYDQALITASHQDRMIWIAVHQEHCPGLFEIRYAGAKANTRSSVIKILA